MHVHKIFPLSKWLVGATKNNFVHVHKIFPLSFSIQKVRIQVLCCLSKPTMNGGSTCHFISVPMECWHSMQLEQSWSSTVAIIERLYGSGKDVLGKIVFVLRDKGQYHSPWRPVASREQDGIAPNPSGLSLYSPIHPYQSHSILSMMAIVQDQKCSN